MSIRRHIVVIFIALFCVTALTVKAEEHKAVSVTYLDARQARALLKENDALIILDVRTKGEYKRGHIEGAIRNNYFSTKFKKRLRALDKTQPYLVHCKSGHRSQRVVKIMLKEGFTNITHLDGGYDAWKKLPPKTG